ncbi:MAG: hypothetical protein ACI8XB_000650 [Patiriisocius sp.]|jgi:hypothetical protein
MVIAVLSQSCLTTSYWTTPKSLESDTIEFKVFWNYFGNETHVAEKFDKKINELIDESNNYKEYIILFQSNNSLESGKRNFIVHLFNNKVEKEQFLEITEDEMSEFRNLIKSKSFNDSWAKLELDLKFKEFIELFPELNNYYLKQEFEFEQDMSYQFQDLNFVFNSNGRLISWKK